MKITPPNPEYIWLEYGPETSGFKVRFDDSGYIIIINKVTGERVKIYCGEIICMIRDKRPPDFRFGAYRKEK